MIPHFDLSGVLPPYLGPDAAERGLTSPYETDVLEVAQRFATSRERAEILRGLLRYRQALAGIGVVDGFQYLDGSFVEDVERVRGRPPKDIDVLTFFYRPPHAMDHHLFSDFVHRNLSLFDPVAVKAAYYCDAYGIDMNTPGEYLVDATRYFCGLFSHQRDTNIWKGMLKIDLAVGQHDVDALAFLTGAFP